MRYADDRGFAYAVQSINGLFDLFWIDVESAADYEIFFTTDDLDTSVLIHLGHVARNKKTIVCEFAGCFFRHLPIAFKHVGTSHLKHARFVGGNGLVFVIADPDRDVGKRVTDGPRNSLALQGIRCDHDRFRHAIAFKDSLTGLLKKGVPGLFEQRR